MMSSLLLVITFSLFYSCKKNPDLGPVDCSGPMKSFSNEVNIIIHASCDDDSGCHGLGSRNGPGELLNYSQVFNARTSIRSVVLSGEMPRNGRLSTSDRSAIICWIDSGAPNN